MVPWEEKGAGGGSIRRVVTLICLPHGGGDGLPHFGCDLLFQDWHIGLHLDCGPRMLFERCGGRRSTFFGSGGSPHLGGRIVTFFGSGGSPPLGGLRLLFVVRRAPFSGVSPHLDCGLRMLFADGCSGMVRIGGGGSVWLRLILTRLNWLLSNFSS